MFDPGDKLLPLVPLGAKMGVQEASRLRGASHLVVSPGLVPFRGAALSKACLRIGERTTGPGNPAGRADGAVGLSQRNGLVPVAAFDEERHGFSLLMEVKALRIRRC